MKSLTQVLNTLAKIAAGEPAHRDPEVQKRYGNTLSNMGLIERNEAPFILSRAGQDVLDYTTTNQVTPDSLKEGANRLHALAIETIVLRNLVENSRDEDFYYRLRNIQRFMESIPTDRLDEALDDLELLLFLQLIFCVGYEVERFFRLSPADQAVAKTEFIALADDLPDDEPTDDVQSLIYTYARPYGKKNIQKDIRFRVQSSLQAYRKLKEELGEKLPTVDANLRITQRGNPVRPGTTHADLYKLQRTPNATVPTSPRQWIVAGCPGAGKSYYLSELIKSNSPHVIRTTFHSETSYFDFVGSYKPCPVYEQDGKTYVGGDGSQFSRGKPIVDYQFVPGPLLKAFIFALANPNVSVVLLIEEINRANCGAVFGDFLQLLDRSADGSSLYGINPNPDVDNYLCLIGIQKPGSQIKLPGNLFIWATMNSADQGTFPIDSAFRRRWSFIYMGHTAKCAYPEADSKIRYNGKSHDWDEFRGRINDELLKLAIHEDKLIGPFFLSPRELQSPKAVLEKLFLYLWDDVLRFQQAKLFSPTSFSSLATEWKDGDGAPLHILT